MQVAYTILEVRERLRRLKSANTSRNSNAVGLVPTMGALHEGHLTLIREAKANCDITVVSIFVNPTQFGPNEDLDRYPRTLEADLAWCEKEGVDVVFCPDVQEMYPEKSYLSIQIDAMTNYLCGASRPGHFNGVLQVVNKFFQIVRPNHAFFGQKDIQQFVLIQTMVKEFNIDVELHRVSTVRESDGLALSSRNRYLSEEDRGKAPMLYEILGRIESKLLELGQTAGERSPQSTNELREAIGREQGLLEANGFKNDYLEVVEYETLQPVESLVIGSVYVVAIAAFLGNTRLIDNKIVTL